MSPCILASYKYTRISSNLSFSGAPSRETHVQTLSWQHLDPPRLVVYVRRCVSLAYFMHVHRLYG